MIKYTDEMWLNDRLWESEPEDSDLMLKLFHEILYQARKLGFKNPIEIYEANGKICYEIYLDHDHKDACMAGYSEPLKSGCYCKHLIRDIKNILTSSPAVFNVGDFVRFKEPITIDGTELTNTGLIGRVEKVDEEGVWLTAFQVYIQPENATKYLEKVEIS